MKITAPLLCKGYTLYLDNYSNSPVIAVFLKRHTVDCIVTLRLNRYLTSGRKEQKEPKKRYSVY
jgi:hypothetical protein